MGPREAGEIATRTRRVGGRDIELFTELTGDRNPLHYDHEAASRSRFGGVIVQGGVTSGLLNAVVAEDLPGPGSVFLHVDWSFKAPVRPGDEITAEVEVLEARQDKPITRRRTTITNQDDVVVLKEPMTRYLIERRYHVSQDEVPTVAKRSRQIAADHYPEVVWEHSHVV